LIVYRIPGSEASLYFVLMFDEPLLRFRYEAVRSFAGRARPTSERGGGGEALGYGGIAAAAHATKVARSTIELLRACPDSLSGKVRRKGGGALE
jgi:hypothetical protein